MPYSDDQFDTKLKSIIKKSKYSKYFDIGIGAGKIGKIIREIKGQSVYLSGVEIEGEYIDKFSLNTIYDDIYNGDAIDYVDSKPSFSTECVFIGDCIEHIRKSDGIDLINYLVYRSKEIIILFPNKYIQYDWMGHTSEAHRSVWSKTDFDGFEYTYETRDYMNLVRIKGYIDDPCAITP